MYLQFGLLGKKLALDKCFEEKITRNRYGRGLPLLPTSNRGEWAGVRRSFQKIWNWKIWKWKNYMDLACLSTRTQEEAWSNLLHWGTVTLVSVFVIIVLILRNQILPKQNIAFLSTFRPSVRLSRGVTSHISPISIYAIRITRGPIKLYK